MAEGQGITLELVHQWLSCDETAGNRLWSGLFEEYLGKGKQWGLAHLKRKGYRINYKDEQALRDYEMECLAADQLGEIHDRLKPREATSQEESALEEAKDLKRGKTPKDFPTLEKFHRFIEKSLARGIRTLIREHLGIPPGKRKYVPIDAPGTGGDETEEQGMALGEIIPTGHPSPHDELVAKQRKSCASQIIQKFRDFLETSRQLQSYFDALIEACKAGQAQVPLEDVAEEIIDFLEAQASSETPVQGGEPCEGVHEGRRSAERHWEQVPKEVLAYFREKGINQRPFNQNTFNSNNRRLREKWRKFRSGPARELWERYKET